jgi:FtsP/CotA-like multicopper oxidase with cupredoxin domain
MRVIFRYLMAILICCACLPASSVILAQSNACPPRPQPGTEVSNPLNLTSSGGVLSVALSMHKFIDTQGITHYCLNYDTANPVVEAPTLRLNPGDELDLSEKDDLPAEPSDAMQQSMEPVIAPQNNTDCQGGQITAATTNMHFHGLNVAPTCHSDDVITTLLQPGQPAFKWRVKIPENEPLGLNWYHPHAHGYTNIQVGGGASGAIIIQGIEKVRPEVSGLPERVLIIRQQSPPSGLPQLTLNFQPALAPAKPSPVIVMAVGSQEFWRVANASTGAFLNLQIWCGTTPQILQLIAIDGVPLTTPQSVATVSLPPAGRGEFIVQAPVAGESASFQNLGTDTGPQGIPNPAQEMAVITTGGTPNLPLMPRGTGSPQGSAPQRFANMMVLIPTAKRNLYFSQSAGGTHGPTRFYLTVDGQRPHVFTSNEPPAIETQVGAVEDWTIENRTQEDHAFHIHQIHFTVLDIKGQPVTTPYVADTVTVPYWTGTGPYPSVKLRMDFRDPNIAGTFVYHCHILFHEDSGMMAKIKVDPAN